MRTCQLCLGHIPDPHDPTETRQTCRCEPVVRIRHEFEAERLRLNREHGVITSLDDLTGWKVTSLTRWKPGVVRYLATRGHEERSGFARDSVFAAVQLPP